MLMLITVFFIEMLNHGVIFININELFYRYPEKCSVHVSWKRRRTKKTVGYNLIWKMLCDTAVCAWQPLPRDGGGSYCYGSFYKGIDLSINEKELG